MTTHTLTVTVPIAAMLYTAVGCLTVAAILAGLARAGITPPSAHPATTAARLAAAALAWPGFLLLAALAATAHLIDTRRAR